MSWIPAAANGNQSPHPVVSDIFSITICVCILRTSTRLAHLLLVALFRRLLSGHLLTHHRKGVLFVLLHTALQDVTGRSVLNQCLKCSCPTVRKFHVLSIAVVPVRSSHTRTTPSLPEETITLLFVPATESTPRKDVVPSLCPSKECEVPRDVLSNKYIL